MKHKIFALILALTVASWAQTATQTTPPANASPEKPKCCGKVAKEGAACARHTHSADGKEAASCCAGKSAANCCGKSAESCMKSDKTTASCCKDSCGKNKTEAACCGKDCGKGCCSSDKKEKTAKTCCAHEMCG